MVYHLEHQLSDKVESNSFEYSWNSSLQSTNHSDSIWNCQYFHQMQTLESMWQLELWTRSGEAKFTVGESKNWLTVEYARVEWTRCCIGAGGKIPLSSHVENFIYLIH